MISVWIDELIGIQIEHTVLETYQVLERIQRRSEARLIESDIHRMPIAVYSSGLRLLFDAMKVLDSRLLFVVSWMIGRDVLNELVQYTQLFVQSVVKIRHDRLRNEGILLVQHPLHLVEKVPFAFGIHMIVTVQTSQSDSDLVVVLPHVSKSVRRNLVRYFVQVVLPEQAKQTRHVSSAVSLERQPLAVSGRVIVVSDAFLRKIVPELLARSSGVQLDSNGYP